MKILKSVLLYLLVAFYLFMGAMHFANAGQYDAMIPIWLPAHKLLIIGSGAIEILLGLLLLPQKTRATAAKLIVGMLLVFLCLIHIPESLSYYATKNEKFAASLIRLPIQLFFMVWAYLFTKKQT